MRQRRIIRRRRVKRRPRRRRKNTFRRPATSNVLKIYRGMLPPRAFVKHRYTRQIRLEEAFDLPWASPTLGLQGSPCVLIASCNNPMAPFNQSNPSGGTIGNSPAFLNGSGVWDVNTKPMLWDFFQRMYSQWTVVGSKIRVTYQPFGVPLGDSNLLEFTMLTKQSARVVAPGSTDAFPSTNRYPSIVKDQPAAYTKTWSANSPYSTKQMVMSRSFSTRKGFGKSRGNVIGESNLQGQAAAKFSEQMSVFPVGSTASKNALYPEEEYFYQMYINPSVSSAATVEGRTLPPGLFTINVEYSTVWTERADLPDA